MKLSIVVIFSDRDKEFASEWLDNVKKNILVEHEVVMVDNTTDGTLVRFDGVTYVRGGDDVGIFQARRRGCDAASGEYIWYCDGDDDVLKLTEFNYTEDIVCFNYLCRLGDDPADYPCKDPYPTSYLASGHFYHWYWKATCKNMVWNKFFRRALLMRIYKCVPVFEMYVSEDTLLCIIAEMLADVIYIERRAFYRYYKNAGSSEGGELENIEQLKRNFKGTKEGWAVYDCITTEEQRKASGIETELIIINLCKYAIKQARRCRKFMGEFASWLCAYFSDEFVKNVLETYADDFTEEEKKICDYMCRSRHGRQDNN